VSEVLFLNYNLWMLFYPICLYITYSLAYFVSNRRNCEHILNLYFVIFELE